MMKGISLIAFVFIFSLASLSAFNFESGGNININVGSITNLSQLSDVDVGDPPSDGYFLIYNATLGAWEDQIGAAAGDTNETTRVNNLVGTNCSAGDFVFGHQTDGTIACSTPAGGGITWTEATNGTLLEASDWNSTNISYDNAWTNFTTYNTTWAAGGAGNQTDQWTNTTSNVTFQNVNITENLGIDGQLINGVNISNVSEGVHTTNCDSKGSCGDVAYLDFDNTADFNVSSGGDICITNGNCLSSVSGDNASWNESHADTLYAGIEWDYNQTTPAQAYADALNITQQNWVDALFVKIANIVSLVGNWTLDKPDYANYSNSSSTFNPLISENCSEGNFIEGLDGGIVYCDAPAGSGDITAVNMNDSYFETNNSQSGDTYHWLNESRLNGTIGDFNDSMTSYVDAQDVLFNNSIAYYANTTINDSMKSYVDGTFILQSEEGNLNVNSSDIWVTTEGLIEDVADINGSQINNDLNWINATSTTFNASDIETISGTLTSGNLLSVQIANDDNTYNITEDVGADPLTIIINFTEIDTFNSILMREWYTGGLGHEIEIGLYNCVGETYDEEFGDITDMAGFAFTIRNVFDPASYLCTGDDNVSMRLRHVQNGNAAHTLRIDYAVLIQGISTTTTTEHDALSGRDDIENHPWALPIDGSLRNATNITVEDNVTAEAYLGDGQFLSNLPGDSWAGNFTDYYNKTDVDTNISEENSTMKAYVDFQNILFNNSVAYYANTTVNDSMKAYVDGTFILSADEGDLDVNRSDHWDDFDIANTTQFEDVGGALTIVLSWFSDQFDVYFGAKDTDDLSQGSTNLYDNQSWNQTLIIGNTEITNGNMTADYFFGNGSQLTNVAADEVLWNANYSTFLTHTTWANAINGTLLEASDWNATNESYYAVTGDILEGNMNTSIYNITIGGNSNTRICLNQACDRYMFDNGTGIVIQG